MSGLSRLRPPCRTRALLAVISVMALVAVAVSVDVGHAPEASADAGSYVPARGFYYSDEAWHLSANEADSSGDHYAYFATDLSRGTGLVSLVNPFRLPLALGSSYNWNDPAEALKMDTDSGVVESVSWTGPAGMMINGDASGYIERPRDMLISCDARQSTCNGMGATITINWHVDVWPADCYIEWYPYGPLAIDRNCTRSTVTHTDTRTFDWPPPGENQAPHAGFTWERSTDEGLEVRFTSTSTDPEGGNLTYAWDFGDGTTSTEASPTHTFEQLKAYQVTLTVTDGGGKTGAHAEIVDLRGLVVNSTADGGAIDTVGRGCDTGGTVGDQPECTLRAAIEVLNQKGEGTITFDIDSGTVPTIATASALPEVTAPGAVIDGTTQAAGAVRVTAGDRSGAALTISGAGAQVTGLVIDQSALGLNITAADVTLEGNVIGASADGGSAGSVTFGVRLQNTATGSVVRDNVIVAATGVELAAADITVEQNSVGVSRAGAVVGDMGIGILALGRDTQVTGNTIRARTVGVGVITSDGVSGDGSTVSGNNIGVTAGGTELAGQGEGVRVSGAKDVTVTGNRIDPHLAGGAGVSVSGKLELFATASDVEGEYTYTFLYPDSPVAFEGDTTGRDVTVSNNLIGAAALGLPSSGSSPRNAVVAWAGADHVTITGNTVAGQTGSAIETVGGANHVVTANTVGRSSGGADAAAATGILVDGSTGVTIGRAGEGNTVLATTHGIQAAEDSSGTITGNTVTARGAGPNTAGISALTGAKAIAVESNTVTGFSGGVVANSESAQITANVVSESGTGISTTSAAAAVERNVVTETTSAAIVVAGADTTVEDNLVGRTTANGTNVGNTGQGIVVDGGPARLTRNTVAGSGGNGIQVAPTAKATLRSNKIVATTGTPIVSSNAAAPPLLGAAMKTTYDDADRTALLLTGMPDGAGDIEVFANASCADPEAEKVLGVTKQKAAGQTSKVILLKDRRSDDNFTVTFTDDQGRTSELSTCASGEVYPDSDGDGSPDPLDELVGGAGDPTTGGYLTDNEQLIRLKVIPEVTDEEGDTYGGGHLAGAGPVDVPPGKPATIDLPYGLIGFTVEGFTRGGTTAVGITVVDGEQIHDDDAYWKYGPLATGEDPVWYDFSLDEESATGAKVSDPVEVAGFGYRRNMLMIFTDGARGDDDGAMNGSIHDPGGIARELTGFPTDPTPTTQPPTTVTPTTGAPATDGLTVDPGATDAAAAVTPEQGSLPYTGSDDGLLWWLATALLAAGTMALVIARAGRRHETRSS